ncbi:MAG: TonB-dependent receptor [Bacteroidota bacterium]
MKKLLCCLLFLVGIGSLCAQNKAAVEGKIVDTSLVALPGATIVLMNASDSIMQGFSISDEKGRFIIRDVSAGDYLLQVSFIGYEIRYEALQVPEGQATVEGPVIQMNAADALLDEILVSGERIPMAIRKDTIEYNADAFQTREGAKVEDLLKKLPGVEVDRQGNVKAQGENVQQIFVDGKAFFGNDPKIATKNLPADAIDKVQVFDKKSEMAEFSGIDDGNERRAINLQLKDGKKKGYFGDLEAGYGTADRYKGKMNLNRFGKDTQLSMIGMANNVNEQGFSFEDYLGFIGGLGNLMAGDSEGAGRVRLDLNEAGLPLNLARQDGILRTHAGGLNFNRDFGPKTEWTSSYFFNSVENELERSIFQQSLLGDSGFVSESEGRRDSENSNHRLNVSLRHKIDSTQNLIFRGSLGWNEAALMDAEERRNLNVTGQLESAGLRSHTSEGDNLSWKSSLTYRRRFRQKGRTLVADVAMGQQRRNTDALIYARNTFFEANLRDTLDQRQAEDERLNNYRFRLSFTEPLKRGKYLEFKVAHQTFDNRLGKDFFDRQGGVALFNSFLSRAYEQRYTYEQGGMNFRWNRRDYQLTLGAALQYYRLEGRLLSETSPIKDSYLRLLPNLRFQRDFGGAKELTFDYRTSIQEPRLEQLQPIIDNSNPLLLYQGNPDLVPEYKHDWRVSYLSFSQFSQISLFGSISATYTQNKIINAQSIDASLRQRLRPVNVEDDWTTNSNVSFGAPLRFLKSRMSLDMGHRYSRSILFLNDQQNRVNRQNWSIEWSVSNRNTELVDLQIGAALGYNRLRYDVNEEFNQSYLDQTYFGDVRLQMGKRTSLTTSMDYTIYSAESFGERQDVPIWKASVSQYFFKKKGRLTFSVYDILDRNLGLRRNNDLNFVREERITALGRYFMLSAGWSIAGFGSKKGLEVTTKRRSG